MIRQLIWTLGITAGLVGMSRTSCGTGFPVYGNLSKATYKLQGSNGGGTGFQVETPSGAKFILTNWHVCETGVGTLVATSEFYGAVNKVKILYSDPIKDLCLVDGFGDRFALNVGEKFNMSYPVYSAGYPVSSREHLKTTFGFPTQETTVKLAFGKRYPCPKGFEDNGKDCVLPMNLIDTTLSAEPGCSGSAVVNSHGVLVGVLNSTNGKYGSMILLPDVKAFLKGL